MIKKIMFGQVILAVIIPSKFKRDGIEFFTPNDFSQQLAYMSRPKGYSIPPHVHNEVKREVFRTNEVLYIKNGKVRVDFYSDDRNYLESTILETGDVILLAFGGHGFHMLEDSEIIEIKQGPYADELDKVRFDSVVDSKVILKRVYE